MKTANNLWFVAMCLAAYVCADYDAPPTKVKQFTTIVIEGLYPSLSSSSTTTSVTSLVTPTTSESSTPSSTSTPLTTTTTPLTTVVHTPTVKSLATTYTLTTTLFSTYTSLATVIAWEPYTTSTGVVTKGTTIYHTSTVTATEEENGTETGAGFGAETIATMPQSSHLATSQVPTTTKTTTATKTMGPGSPPIVTGGAVKMVDTWAVVAAMVGGLIVV